MIHNFEKLKPYLYHVQFDTRYDMTSTMIRIGEYYESPEFKGKIFTLAQFRKWYISTKKRTKRFTYYEDWSGYNIPSKELKPFIDGRFKPLSKKEQELVNLVKDIKGRYYLIATFKRNKEITSTLDHEITHAIYAFEKEYKKKVNDYINSKSMHELQDFLIKKGYSDKKSILIDEMNAYLVNDLIWLRKKKLKGEHYTKYSKDLIKIKNDYAENNKDNKK